MARGSQYTWEYRSTPENLTRPFLIPPIEQDPFFKSHQTRRSRREQASMVVHSVEPHLSSQQSRGAAPAPPRTDERGKPLSASERRHLAQVAQAQAAQAQQLATQRQHRQMRPAQLMGAAPNRTSGRKRRRGSFLGCLIPIVIILVIIGSVASPIIEGIIDRLTPDENSGPVTVSEYGAEPTTDEIIDMTDAAGDHQNESFEAYASVTSVDGDSYQALLAGYAPSSPDDMEWEADAVIEITGDAAPGVGDLIRGEFVFDGDPDAYTAELRATSWGPAEYHDLMQDIRITETARADGRVAYDVEVTNSADVERSYSFDVRLVPSGGSEAQEGRNYVSTDVIDGGETVVSEETSYLYDVGDADLEFVITDPYRY